MNNQLKLLFYIILIVGIFYFIQDKFKFLDISFLDGKISINNDKESTVDTNTVVIETKDGKSITVNVERADTPEKKTLGLAYRTALGEYSGMLFIFDDISNTPFTMKDMKIPLDFIFLDKDGIIVDIKEEQPPCSSTTCPAILSNVMYKNVLEVNGGFCLTNGVKVGDTIKIN